MHCDFQSSLLSTGCSGGGIYTAKMSSDGVITFQLIYLESQKLAIAEGTFFFQRGYYISIHIVFIFHLANDPHKFEKIEIVFYGQKYRMKAIWPAKSRFLNICSLGLSVKRKFQQSRSIWLSSFCSKGLT